jgi:hypothetical protein
MVTKLKDPWEHKHGSLFNFTCVLPFSFSPRSMFFFFTTKSIPVHPEFCMHGNQAYRRNCKYFESMNNSLTTEKLRTVFTNKKLDLYRKNVF